MLNIRKGVELNSNTALNKAKRKSNNNEFYTSYSEIKQELIHYHSELIGKTILCNTDFPLDSDFSLYFIRHFNSLHLKSLICTAFTAPSLDHFDESGEKIESVNGRGWILNLDQIPEWINESTPAVNIHRWLIAEKKIKRLRGSGDFRSQECLSYVTQADVIITNPPFSLFRDFFNLLMEYKKNFLIIGNLNILTYNKIFPIFMKNEVWIGHRYGSMSFRVPKETLPRPTRFCIDQTGQKWRSLGNAIWLTNLPTKNSGNPLIVQNSCLDHNYLFYDQLDAIEIPHLSEIPTDYSGIMGVPITYLFRHNPECFQIVGYLNNPTIHQKQIYKRILIRNKLLK